MSPPPITGATDLPSGLNLVDFLLKKETIPLQILIRSRVSQHNIQNIQATIQNYSVYQNKQKTQSIDANPKMIQMLKLSDKNFKTVIITMLHE